MVYFPQDKLVFTGDVAFSGPSFLGDGYVKDWPTRSSGSRRSTSTSSCPVTDRR